jgi:anaerobic magnesium-protoporphyrin IX monomethyl ester cyclase
MRVLLAAPRSHNPKQMYREYPLGIGFLGTILRQHGHEVRIFDQNVEGLDDALLMREVARFGPEVVGFSVITPNYPVARGQIAQLKRAHPEVRIIAGGIHATLFPADLLADGADAVVLGEGEPVIVELVERLAARRGLGDLPGVAWRDAAGKVVQTPRPPGSGAGPGPGASRVAALDELPIIDRTLYRLDQYTHHSMLASRGCPHRCAFCCNYTGTILVKGVAVRQHQHVLDEMRHLRDRFGAREVFFADDIFLLRRRDVLQFCAEATAEKLGVRWIGQMRADAVDDAVAAALAGAGCQRVYFGVESGSDAILERAHKGMTTAEIRQGIRAAVDAGLRVKTGWIYGLPGSLDEQYASIPFMLDLRPHEISIHQLIPFPGTVYYQEPGKYGIRIENPKAFESFCYGGLDGPIQFDYLSHNQLVQLLEDTANALEAAGYVNSDRATPGSQFIYTTPLSWNSMNVFRPAAASLVE